MQEHRARIAEGAPAPIGTAARSKERFEDGPLLVGQVHAVEYDSDRNAVSGGVPIYETGSSLSLVPWKRISWKKDPQCDLKGHANHWTPQESLAPDR